MILDNASSQISDHQKYVVIYDRSITIYKEEKKQTYTPYWCRNKWRHFCRRDNNILLMTISFNMPCSLLHYWVIIKHERADKLTSTQIHCVHWIWFPSPSYTQYLMVIISSWMTISVSGEIILLLLHWLFFPYYIKDHEKGNFSSNRVRDKMWSWIYYAL